MNAPGAAGRAARSPRARFTAAGRLLLATLALLMLQAWPARGAPTADEARVNAAYVVNFVRYTRWPQAGTGPLRIDVLGTADEADVLRELARRAGPVDGRPLLVRRLPLASVPPHPDEARRALGSAAGQSQVIYVGGTHRGWSTAVAAASAGRPILTIGPGREFLDEGGMIGLYLDRGRVRFDVNAAAIRSSPVDVSARLLVLARPEGG